MIVSTDVEQFQPDFSDEDLAKVTQANRDEESAVGALKELIRRRSQLLVEVIPQVLDDPQQSAAAKAAAANALGKGLLDEATGLLMQHLNTRNPRVFANLVRALGRIGGEAALRQLEQIKGPDDPKSQRELRFAQVLLSHRLRLDRHRLPLPDEGDLPRIDDGEEMKITQVRLKTFEEVARDVQDELPGTELVEETAVQITCQSNELILGLTKEFGDLVAIESLRERAALPLILLKKAYSLERYALDTIFFTQPLELLNEVALLGTRPGGELTYAGRIRFLEEQIAFNVHSLATRYTPAVEVEGFSNLPFQSIEITRAISGQQVTETGKTGVPRPAATNMQ